MIIFTCAETIITLIYAYYLKNTIHSYFLHKWRKLNKSLNCLISLKILLLIDYLHMWIWDETIISLIYSYNLKNQIHSDFLHKRRKLNKSLNRLISSKVHLLNDYLHMCWNYNYTYLRLLSQKYNTFLFSSQVKKTQQKLKLPNFIKNSSANWLSSHVNMRWNYNFTYLLL